jgi:hypothetical protein
MKKYRYLITALIILVLIVGSGVALYFVLVRVQKNLDEIEKKQLEMQIEEEQIKNLPNLEATYKKINSEESKLAVVYTEDRVVEVIRSIESLAKAENVTLTIAQQKAEEKTKPTKKESSDKKDEEKEKKPELLTDKLPFEKSVRLEIRAQGEYKNIRNLIHKLETAPYALDILSLDVSIAPLDEDVIVVAAPTASTVTDSLFLLEGSKPVVEELVIPRTEEKVVFVINLVLYTQ